jgi:polysaccharide export outer membrane protein
MKHFNSSIRVFLFAVALLQPWLRLPAQEAASPATARLRIGPGDLLDIKIFNAPEHDQTVRVDDIGDATLALIGKVHLAGLTTDDGEALIAEKHKSGNFFLDPKITILIKEYSTQGVSVLGEVSKPGVYPALGSRTVLDMISQAGGITPAAGNEAIIQRRSGGSILSVKLSVNPRRSLDSDVEVWPGDKVIVARAAIVYVIGNVNRPGGFVMQNDGRISILQAVAMATGVNGTASLSRARLIRKTTSGYVELKIPLKKILNGKENDMEMQAEDILYIPNSSTRSVFYHGVPNIIPAVASATIYTTM